MVLLVIISGVAVFGYNIYRSSVMANVFKKDNFGVTAELSSNPDVNITRVFAGDSVAEAEGDVLKLRSMDGKNNWSRKLKGDIRNLCATGDNVVSVDSTGFIVSFDRAGKTLWSRNINELPEALLPDGKGGILVEYFRQGSGRLEYFRADGSKSEAIETEGAKITAFASDKGGAFVVYLIDTAGDSIIGRMMSFTSAGKMIWAKDMGDKLVYSLSFTNGTLIAVVEDGILKINEKNGDFTSEQPGGKIEAFYFTDKNGAILFNNGGYSYLYYCDRNCRLIKSSQIPEDIKRLAVSENNIIMYNADYMILADRTGRILFDYSFSTVVNRVFFSEDGTLYADMGLKLQKLEGGNKR